jgi:hypothetical protein
LEQRIDLEEPAPKKIHRHAMAVILTEFVLAAFLSGWITLEYLHNIYLQHYVKSTIQSNASILEIAVPVGIAAIAASLYLQHRGDVREVQAAVRREEILKSIKFAPVTRPVETIPHQLFSIPRPARDPNFRVRKTKAKGKISRNRRGQRVPPEE